MLAVACSPPAPPEQKENGLPARQVAQGDVSKDDSHGSAVPVPTASKLIGQPQAIIFPDKSLVDLQSMEVQLADKVGCAVALSQDGGPAQTIITIGEGETEVLTCGKLKAAGHVPSALGAQRIALLYETYAPHAEVLQPVILERSGKGATWELNAQLAQKIGEDGDLTSIRKIRVWISAKVELEISGMNTD